MGELNTKSILHKRMCCFVDWIAPDPDTLEEIAERATLCRKYIKQNAEDDGLIVTSTPKSGSFEKKNGLRRHYKGNAEVDGLDVDIPIVVKPVNEDGEKLDELLKKFEAYTRKSYPDTKIEKTKSSIKLTFADNVSFDIVPMLATDKDDEQILIRRTGDKIRTSVQKHNDFVKGRTKKSNDQPGRVKFNECIRLMKWWREMKSSGAYYLADDEKPASIIIDLLCAKAFDKLNVEKTYAETLVKWSGFLADLVRNKRAVIFTDHYSSGKVDPNAIWTVLDSVNSENNITKNWTNGKIEELAGWFEEARDTWPRIIRYNEDEEDGKSLDQLITLYGTPFKNHCSN